MSIERVVCLNCIDGRAQLPVIRWIQEQYNVVHVDMITEPGMNGVLASENSLADQISRKVKLSIDRNNSQLIFVVAHFDCKGNPVCEDTHRTQVQSAISFLGQQYSHLPIIGIWVNEDSSIDRI